MRRPALLSRRTVEPEGPDPRAAVVVAEPVPVDPQSGELVPHDPGPERVPLYPRLLRLRRVHPNAWQRATLGEGMALAGGVLALADLASAWTVVVLPVAVAVVVKGHDLLAGVLAGSDGTGSNTEP